MKRHFCIAFLMAFLFAGNLFAQVTASGVVVDAATGEPVIGASILEDGTTNGTITDFDGQFTLSVAQGAQLVISMWATNRRPCLLKPVCAFRWQRTARFWKKWW